MARGLWCTRFLEEIFDGQNYNVYYTIDRSLNSYRGQIEAAMREIEFYSRIRFEPRRRQRCFLKITRDDGCWFEGIDACRPRISLGMGCTDHGTILHELLHAIGFEHEHNRPDRDNYVIINEGNIKYGAKGQFKKLGQKHCDWMDFKFDFNSIMIYGSYEFSKNGGATIQRKNGGLINRNKKLSALDIQKLGLL